MSKIFITVIHPTCAVAKGKLLLSSGVLVSVCSSCLECGPVRASTQYWEVTSCRETDEGRWRSIHELTSRGWAEGQITMYLYTQIGYRSLFLPYSNTANKTKTEWKKVIAQNSIIIVEIWVLHWVCTQNRRCSHSSNLNTIRTYLALLALRMTSRNIGRIRVSYCQNTIDIKFSQNSCLEVPLDPKSDVDDLCMYLSGLYSLVLCQPGDSAVCLEATSAIEHSSVDHLMRFRSHVHSTQPLHCWFSIWALHWRDFSN